MYVEYFFKPIAERLVSKSNERLINILLYEAKEILISCSKPGLLVYSKGLNGYILNVLSNQLLEKKMFKSIKRLLDDYEEIMRAILCNHNNTIDIKILQLGKSNFNGRELDIRNKDDQNEMEKTVKILHNYEFTSIVEMLHKILYKGIELKEKKIIDHVLGIYQRMVFGISSLFYLAHTYNKFILLEEQQSYLINHFLECIKNAYFKSIDAGVYPIDEIKHFFPSMVMANPLFHNKMASSLPIKHYLESMIMLSEKYSITRKLFIDGVSQEIIDACKHFAKDMYYHQNSILSVLDSFKKILNNIRKKNSTLIAEELEIIKEQIMIIKNILRQERIIEELCPRAEKTIVSQLRGT